MFRIFISTLLPLYLDVKVAGNSQNVDGKEAGKNDPPKEDEHAGNKG